MLHCYDLSRDIRLEVPTLIIGRLWLGAYSLSDWPIWEGSSDLLRGLRLSLSCPHLIIAKPSLGSSRFVITDREWWNPSRKDLKDPPQGATSRSIILRNPLPSSSATPVIQYILTLFTASCIKDFCSRITANHPPPSQSCDTRPYASQCFTKNPAKQMTTVGTLRLAGCRKLPRLHRAQAFDH